MKIGSIVECVDNLGCKMPEFAPKRHTPYTVSEIDENLISLEEITLPIWMGNTPYMYNMERFRELIPPIANIEEHINSNTLEPELI